MKLIKKTRLVAASLLFIALLFGCREERNLDRYGKKPEIEGSPSQEGNPAEDREGTLLLSVNNVITPIVRSESEDPMVSINSLTFLFFSGTGDEDTLLERKHIEEISSGSQVIPLKLPIRKYSLVVVANANSKFLSTWNEGCLWSTFNEAQKGAKKDLLNLNTETTPSKLLGIMQTNEQGPVPVGIESFVSEKVPAPTPIQVKLTSTVARFMVYGKPTLEKSLKISSAVPSHFFVSGRSCMFHYLRRLSNLTDESNTPEARGDNSPYGQRYAQSPGYTEISSCEKEKFIDLANTYRKHFLGAFTDEIIKKLATIPLQKEDIDLFSSELYTVETTIDEAHQKYTLFLPRLVLLLPVYPASLDESEPFDPKGGWASFRGYYTRGSELFRYLEALKRGEQSVKIPDGFPESFNVFAKSKLLNNNEIWDSQNSQKLIKQSFEIEGLKYYKNSLNYYSFPIRHKRDIPNTKYGAYGIVRNFSYTFRIQKINRLGDPVLRNFSQDVGIYQDPKEISISIGSVNPVEISADISL